jgi:hypothetical protein
MKRSLLVAFGTLFLAVGCAHQVSQPANLVRVVVNAPAEIARQFDAAALQRMVESELRHVTLTNPRPVKLTVNITLDSVDELFYQPHERLKSGTMIDWLSVFDGTVNQPVHGGAGQQSSDEIRPVALRNEKSGRPVVVGSYTIAGEMGALLDWKPIVLLANDPQFSGPRSQQESIRTAARYLAERVMLVDDRLRRDALFSHQLGVPY